MPGPATQDEPDTSERKPVVLEGEAKVAERSAAGEGFLLYVHDARRETPRSSPRP
jgi:hypothetical protein